MSDPKRTRAIDRYVDYLEAVGKQLFKGLEWQQVQALLAKIRGSSLVCCLDRFAPQKIKGISTFGINNAFSTPRTTDEKHIYFPAAEIHIPLRDVTRTATALTISYVNVFKTVVLRVV